MHRVLRPYKSSPKSIHHAPETGFGAIANTSLSKKTREHLFNGSAYAPILSFSDADELADRIG